MNTTLSRRTVLSHIQAVLRTPNSMRRCSAWPACLAAWIFLTAGCATVQPGHDAFVVNAERTQAIAFAAVDTFLALEHANRAHYQTNLPAVHAIAESLRKRAPAAFLAVKDAVRLYKANRTPESKATAQGALAGIAHLGLEASRALAALNTPLPQKP